MTIRYGPEMRVLIVGGGIAGLTLAGLLQQCGFQPVVVEKSPNYGEAGYVLGLFPAGSRIFKGLGLYPRLEDAGVELARYEVANAQGECLHVYHFGTLAESYGPTLGISRTALVDVLRSGISSECLRLGTTVELLTQTPDEAQATFSDGSAETFDLVVGCDGLCSRTREMIFGDAPLTYLGLTGWCRPGPFTRWPMSWCSRCRKTATSRSAFTTGTTWTPRRESIAPCRSIRHSPALIFRKLRSALRSRWSSRKVSPDAAGAAHSV